MLSLEVEIPKILVRTKAPSALVIVSSGRNVPVPKSPYIYGSCSSLISTSKSLTIRLITADKSFFLPSWKIVAFGVILLNVAFELPKDVYLTTTVFVPDSSLSKPFLNVQVIVPSFLDTEPPSLFTTVAARGKSRTNLTSLSVFFPPFL